MDASRFGKVLPGVVCILVAGLILSNLHITPFSSAVSDFVGQYIVAAAIPLLMIKADLKKIFLESGRVMLGFAAACVGIVSGALLGYYLLHPWHIGAKVAGMYAGAFVGGTISMIAVANAVQMTPTRAVGGHRRLHDPERARAHGAGGAAEPQAGAGATSPRPRR